MVCYLKNSCMRRAGGRWAAMRLEVSPGCDDAWATAGAGFDAQHGRFRHLVNHLQACRRAGGQAAQGLLHIAELRVAGGQRAIRALATVERVGRGVQAGQLPLVAGFVTKAFCMARISLVAATLRETVSVRCSAGQSSIRLQ